MNRIETIASRRKQDAGKLLIPYLVAGDPDIDTTLAVMHELVSQGADIIELGIPFSDPASDGPVIQRGVERALAAGTTLAQVLDLVERFRQQDTDTGIVLMGYLNPVEIFGYQAFAERCKQVGVDGVLVVDMPPAEADTLAAALKSHGVERIFLVAPTTSEARAREIADSCSGYLYYVSLKGVTGAAISDRDSVQDNVARLRQMTDLPIVIGFGIKDADSARDMAQLADGIVIGSALVDRIGALGAAAQQDLGACCSVIGAAREAIDNIN